MKRAFFLTAFLTILSLQGMGGTIPITPDRIGKDMAGSVSYLEDPDGDLRLRDVLKKEGVGFKSVERKRKNFGFTRSAYWFRFELHSRMGAERRFLLDLSRSLTNELRLYRVEDGRVIDSARSGDHVPFHKRPYPHRDPVFPIELAEGERATFYLRAESDGEILMFPFKIWTQEAFHSMDRNERSVLGLFYGILIFVVLIFTFFYLILREASFLYYPLYVLSFAFLQFALDGLAYRYLFPGSPYWVDRSVLTASFVTVLLITLYARTYLRLAERSVPLDRIYKGIMAVGILGVFASLLQGTVYSYAYPFVNGLSFGGPIFILFSILFLKKKGYRVSDWFLSAFVLLILGVLTFLAGNLGFVTPNFLTINGLKMGSLGEVICLSFTMVQKYRELQKEKEQERQNSLERLQELNRLKDEYNKELEETVEERTEALNAEREKFRETNREIMSSIRYAQRIQNAILPPGQAIRPFFKDHFVFFRPRDIVSGDIYWFASVTTTEEGESGGVSREITRDTIPERADLTVFSVMDCTGHGVPGAFLSILGHNILNRTLKEPTVNSPGEALEFVDHAVRSTFFNAYGDEEKIEDGMDMGMCAIDHQRERLYFAGANHPCYIVRGGELYELKGDKSGIGGSEQDEAGKFTTQEFSLEKGDRIYLFSDGYPDQFGGPKGKKLKYKAFKELLCEVHDLRMEEQERVLAERFDAWKGDLDQVDDVLVIGVQV